MFLTKYFSYYKQEQDLQTQLKIVLPFSDFTKTFWIKASSRAVKFKTLDTYMRKRSYTIFKSPPPDCFSKNKKNVYQGG